MADFRSDALVPHHWESEPPVADLRGSGLGNNDFHATMAVSEWCHALRQLLVIVIDPILQRTDWDSLVLTRSLKQE
jgi:hypothetical protein